MSANFFPTPDNFRKWLEEHHAKAQELWVGFYKKSSGKQSITWPEAVDAALCFGWIDGIRKGIDEISYKIRFTPRKRNSIWSAVNIKRAQDLTARGLMAPRGVESFQARKKEKSAIYSYEQKKHPELAIEFERKLKANKKAWKFFQKQPAWYRRTAIYRIMSAKQEETRLRRLKRLIEDSENERSIRGSYGKSS